VSPFETMMVAMKDRTEVQVRSMLARFGFDRHKADTKVGSLSGGEKARLLFCLMSFDAPHIMLLDEPTNHLDIDARQALAQAINNYEGAVILVSHDSHLVKTVADQLWLVADGKVTAFDDDLDAYCKLVIKQRKMERDKLKQDARKPKNDNEVDADISETEKQAEALEKKISELQKRKQDLEGEMAEFFAKTEHAAELKKLTAAHGKLEDELLAQEALLENLIKRM
jgi:ATP-binding cassette, subfamily F, member 3